MCQEKDTVTQREWLSRELRRRGPAQMKPISAGLLKKIFPSIRTSGANLGEQLRINITATDDGYRMVGCRKCVTVKQPCRGSDCPAWLGYGLRIPSEHLHRAHNFVFGDRDYVVHIALNVLERHGAWI